jgi:molybdopterin-guanine dinucleotide biosynthesis protein A
MDGSTAAGEVTGAILAGGRATRFHGINKATLDVGGRRIIDRQLEALRQVTVEQLIVANDVSAFAGLGVRAVPDLVAGVGPMGGVFTALEHARSSRVIVLACDLPFVHEAFLRYLVARAREADVVLPRTGDGLHPLCAVYQTRLAPVLATCIAQDRLALHQALAGVRTIVVEEAEIAAFDPDGRLLANVNTPADYAALGPDRP